MLFFIINIGGSSTKLALYKNETEIVTETIRHTSNELASFKKLYDQLNFRKKVVEEFLMKNKIDVKDLSAIISRGALVKPLVSGTYYINEKMVEDAKSGEYGIHPCGLGCEIALDISNGEIPCLTVDPPCVDELEDVSRVSGFPEIERHSVFQSLNHKAKGREIAKKLNTEYEKLKIVITHLGSGISVATHKYGKVTDITNGLEGDGPFGLDRVGTLAAGDWMRLCLSGKYTKDELSNIINGGGGIKAHLGTNNAFEVEEMIENGDLKAELIYQAMGFQVGKGIGAAAAALSGKPDAIIITGGLANSEKFIAYILPMVEWIAPVHIMPDENEIFALVQGAMRGLTSQEKILVYK